MPIQLSTDPKLEEASVPSVVAEISHSLNNQQPKYGVFIYKQHEPFSIRMKFQFPDCCWHGTRSDAMIQAFNPYLPEQLTYPLLGV